MAEGRNVDLRFDQHDRRAAEFLSLEHAPGI
jgi:hypothetical protein